LIREKTEAHYVDGRRKDGRSGCSARMGRNVAGELIRKGKGGSTTGPQRPRRGEVAQQLKGVHRPGDK